MATTRQLVLFIPINRHYNLHHSHVFRSSKVISPINFIALFLYHFRLEYRTSPSYPDKLYRNPRYLLVAVVKLCDLSHGEVHSTNSHRVRSVTSVSAKSTVVHSGEDSRMEECFGTNSRWQGELIGVEETDYSYGSRPGNLAKGLVTKYTNAEWAIDHKFQTSLWQTR